MNITSKGDEIIREREKFFKKAQKVAAKFEAYEMSGDFLERLQSSIEAYESVQVAKAVGQGRAQIKDELAEFIAEGSRLANILDVVVRNKYLGDAGKLGAWNAAWLAEVMVRTSN